MKSDEEIRKDVEDELRWDPDIDITDVAIGVKDGVVSLNGFVPSYAMKSASEAAVKRVGGVVAVANDIEVRVPAIDQRPDPDIARDAVQTLRAQLPYSSQHIRVIVQDGWITLEGEVEWNYQRERAEDAVRWTKGVKGAVNAIQVKPRVAPTDIKKKIEEAFRRHAELDADQIEVEAHDDEVILRGTVHSWSEREEAERAAWAAPGVKRVVDQLAIRP